MATTAAVRHFARRAFTDWPGKAIYYGTRGGMVGGFVWGYAKADEEFGRFRDTTFKDRVLQRAFFFGGGGALLGGFVGCGAFFTSPIWVPMTAMSMLYETYKSKMGHDQ